MLNILIFLVCSIALIHANSDLILSPDKVLEGFNIALIYAPGAGIDAVHYEPLMKNIQNKFTNNGFNLWVGVPHMPLNVTTLGLKHAIDRIAKELYEAGLPKIEGQQKVFYGGHSLGGAVMPMVVENPKKLPQSFDSPLGMMLNGAFLTRTYKSDPVEDVSPGQYEFKTCPVLTVGAELDGLCRITRIAEARYTQIDLSTDFNNALHYFPVTVVNGMSHMQFASGNIPDLVAHRDLIPEISYEQAHEAVANDFIKFAFPLLQTDSIYPSFNALDERQQQSLSLMQPLIDALNLEGYHQFKPPCYCETKDEFGGLEYGTCAEKKHCWGASKWTETASAIMGGGNDYSTTGIKDLTVKGANSQHIVTEEDPSCHLPFIHSGEYKGTLTKHTEPSSNPGNGKSPPLCDAPNGCQLDITTVTQVMYHSGSEMDIWRLVFGNDNIDTGYLPISSNELKSKMKSRSSTWMAANSTDATGDKDEMEAAFNELDGLDAGRCGEINSQAINSVLSMLPQNTKDRYNKSGKKMTVGTDLDVCAAGPCWIWADLEYHDTGSTIELRSPSFPYPNDNPFPCGEKGVEDKYLPCPAGMHYCKLVSPARVMEWMYVDSLRDSASLLAKDTVIEDEKCCTICDTSSGLAKYYSIDTNFGHDACGETCIDPSTYDLIHLFERGLTPSTDSDTPCSDNGYTVYDKTVTHGVGKIATTLDMYNKLSQADKK